MNTSSGLTSGAQAARQAEASELAIRVRGVSKRFKLYHNIVTGPVKEMLLPWRADDFYRSFQAIDGVSFDVRRGEVVGIIGVNGSGKTTLLKLITGLLPADDGEIVVNGSIAPLLALGVGIHPEYTGRENIYYSGLLFGMSPEEIHANIDDIIEFADIGQFIDMPMRTYSSGMQARVLFSLAMSLKRDIFVIDEALATGDTAFFAKSQRRIIDLCESGATILFVSHSLSQVRELCDRVILIDKGRIVGDGDPETEIRRYMRLIFSHKVDEAKARAEAKQDKTVNSSPDAPIKIDRVRLLDAAGQALHGLHTGQRLVIEIAYRSTLRNMPVELFCGFCLKDGSRYVAMINSSELIPPAGGGPIRQELMVDGDGKLTITVDPFILATNHYSLWIIFYDPVGLVPLGEARDICPFFVGRESDSYNTDAICVLPAQLQHESGSKGIY
jgi:ABC-type polysaccharide/polyol phosphate transport system ATPase subunit